MSLAAKADGLRSTTLRRLLVEALRHLGRPRATASLVLIDDAAMRVLNRDYREVDHSTDVLSFSMADSKALADPSAALYLGEIYISVETARVQARRARRSLAREVAHLTVHGLLHLLGHDHRTRAESGAMRALEASTIRSVAGIVRTLGESARPDRPTAGKRSARRSRGPRVARGRTRVV